MKNNNVYYIIDLFHRVQPFLIISLQFFSQDTLRLCIFVTGCLIPKTQGSSDPAGPLPGLL